MKSHIRTNTIARNASTVSGLLVGLMIGSFFGSTVARAADDVLAIARQGNFYIVEQPEGPDLVRCWRQKEPARKLVAVGDRPIIYLAAEASFYAPYNHCTVGYLKQAGVAVSFIKLADIGLHGNGHMMMMEKNSDAIAGDHRVARQKPPRGAPAELKGRRFWGCRFLLGSPRLSAKAVNGMGIR